MPLTELSCEYAACSVFLSRELSVQHLGSRALPRPAPSRKSPQPTIPTTSPRMLSVSEIRKRRLETANQQVTDELSASLEEARHRVQSELEKQRLEQEHMEEERMRKLALEKDLRKAAQIQREKAERERREEEARLRLIEERRIADRERRQRQAQMHREYMERSIQQAEEEKRRRLEARRHMIDERRARPLPLKQEFGVEAADVSFHGWVTVQTTGSVAWRRRYCCIENGTVSFFKNDKHVSFVS
ncbi:uncharacterized protein PHACADRAFT_263676 [Phanerochaete carnosa HHB-10118-sp]|uniref:PH domain-containing protein n=1 Tax=Phanerochaete carnosa (strain HHB-10118-sp) TaxID=650164 RepID=K5VV02_PHACS|nr:uncharacterized protein PHACADRAFT_263676 [Phanerochaete carnosa HHB-10118-sp]EKM50394.1 hypothetical protein PHACADRAFT_263676 [Phanerochaete carnosa HHB-10118-sp]